MISKYLLKIKYNNKEKLNFSIRALFLKGATVLLWVLFIWYLIWISTSLIWTLLSKWWFNELYIPSSINFILYIFLGLIIWTILVSIGFFIIYKYSYFKNKYIKDMESKLFDNCNSNLLWKEIIYFDSNHKDNNILGPKLLSNKELNDLSPSKMLSYGINLYYKGMIKESISILRLVIDHPRSSLLLVEIAKYRLIQILPHLGQVGMEILQKIKGGSFKNENN